jgi:hypothetical protein
MVLVREFSLFGLGARRADPEEGGEALFYELFLWHCLVVLEEKKFFIHRIGKSRQA